MITQGVEKFECPKCKGIGYKSTIPNPLDGLMYYIIMCSKHDCRFGVQNTNLEEAKKDWGKGKWNKDLEKIYKNRTGNGK